MSGEGRVGRDFVERRGGSTGATAIGENEGIEVIGRIL